MESILKISVSPCCRIRPALMYNTYTSRHVGGETRSHLQNIWPAPECQGAPLNLDDKKVGAGREIKAQILLRYHAEISLKVDGETKERERSHDKYICLPFS